MDHGINTASLTSRAEPGFVAQCLQSAAYAGAEAPTRAVAQIIDHFAPTDMDAAVRAGFAKVGVEAPQPAAYGTKSWYAQQLGTAIGMVVPFLALRAGIRGVSGAGALEAAEAVGGVAPKITQLAVQEAALSGTTGLVYGGLFSPSNSANVKNS